MAVASNMVLRRALLYVPASSPRMLIKSLALTCDNITYDLEDSVAYDLKPEARYALREHLSQDLSTRKNVGEFAVRVNQVGTPLVDEDIATFAALPNVSAIVVPKIHSAAHMEYAAQAVTHYSSSRDKPPKILALIESARGIMNLREICAASPQLLDGLIFASEDFTADTGVQRSPELREMLYARSAIVTAGHAAKLTSIIDLVCTSYKGKDWKKVLQRETENGKAMGFNGKQCIHPDQVDRVQPLFVPTPAELEWAVRITIADKKAAEAGRGAWSFHNVMVDRPVVLRAEAIIEKAKRCDLDLRKLKEKWKDQEPT
ncbi:beta subunit of citrate lyase [Rostrohypoxylon terebratum]|nr:beta subunit of citrate lyase [Rostrohypoxylon terebratum]